MTVGRAFSVWCNAALQIPHSCFLLLQFVCWTLSCCMLFVCGFSAARQELGPSVVGQAYGNTHQRSSSSYRKMRK